MAALEAGRSKTETARLFGVSRQAVHNWVAQHKRSGIQVLRSQKRGRPTGGRLTARQETTIAKLITNSCPDQLKLPFYLWTRKTVGTLIAQRFGVRLSVWTVGRLLARRGFTPQKPVRVAFEQNPKAVQFWLQRRFPAIRALARRRHAHVVFVDEAGFMLEPTVRRTWAPKGCTPVLHIADPHHRISVIGAITISPRYKGFCFYFHLSPDNTNFRGPSLVAFLGVLRRKMPGPITLLWDEIPIHRALAVRRFLHEHRTIVVEEFPPYAPELNPVDYVWSYVKYARLANYCPPNLDILRERITDEFQQLQKRPDLLTSFFGATGLSLKPVEVSEDSNEEP